MIPDFKKDINGLLPAIIQDVRTGKVLMLGYMNEESWAKTQETKKLLFTPEVKTEFGQKERRAGIF